MGLLNRTSNQDTTYDSNPTANPATAQNVEFRDEGMGMATGHTNNAVTGGTTQGQYVSPPGQPQERVGGTAGDHYGHGTNTASGSAINGPVDSQGWGTNTSGDPMAATGAVPGGVASHEHGRHAGAATGMGTNTADPNYGGTGPGVQGAGWTAGGAGSEVPGPNSDLPPGAIPGGAWVQYKEGQHLERNGKMEKMLGTVLMSSSLKEKGIAKQQEGANLKHEAESTGVEKHNKGMQQMEAAHAQGRAGVYGGAGTAPGEFALQPSHGPGQGPIVGGSVGGGGRGPM